MSDVSTGLRALADFLDAHPDVVLRDPMHLVYVFSREEIVALARIGGWKKDYSSDNYFSLTREFPGGVQLQVYTDRSEVCRKVVTGTRIEPAKPEQEVETFEWVCDEPLLAVTTHIAVAHEGQEHTA